MIFFLVQVTMQDTVTIGDYFFELLILKTRDNDIEYLIGGKSPEKHSERALVGISVKTETDILNSVTFGWVRLFCHLSPPMVLP